MSKPIDGTWQARYASGVVKFVVKRIAVPLVAFGSCAYFDLLPDFPPVIS